MGTPLRMIGPIGLAWCRDHGAYIVGSGAAWLIDQSAPFPNDLDFILPPHQYATICRMLPRPAEVNKFGGIRTLEPFGKLIYDVWPMELGEYFLTLPKGFPEIACNPIYNIVVRREP